MIKKIGLRSLFLLLFVVAGLHLYADDKKFPDRPNPPRLVNDFAHVMTEGEQDQLESKLVDFERTTSNQILVITIKDLGDYDVSDYAIQLGKAWGVGKSGKNNGVVVLAAVNNHKINISTGKGLEGALTDLTCGRIIRNEMAPAFSDNNYYVGFSKASDAIIAATKGEYKGDGQPHNAKNVPLSAVIIVIIVIVFIIRMFGRGGGGGGNYMSGGGLGGFGTGMLLGSLFGGGRDRGGIGGGDGGFGGGGGDGGFGGFGGGDFGGGGASGSW